MRLIFNNLRKIALLSFLCSTCIFFFHTSSQAEKLDNTPYSIITQENNDAAPFGVFYTTVEMTFQKSGNGLLARIEYYGNDLTNRAEFTVTLQKKTSSGWTDIETQTAVSRKLSELLKISFYPSSSGTYRYSLTAQFFDNYSNCEYATDVSPTVVY